MQPKRLLMFATLLAAGLLPASAAPRVSGAPGADCVPSCAARCGSLPCGDMNASQCSRMRMQCRSACRSRC